MAVSDNLSRKLSVYLPEGVPAKERRLRQLWLGIADFLWTSLDGSIRYCKHCQDWIYVSNRIDDRLGGWHWGMDCDESTPPSRVTWKLTKCQGLNVQASTAVSLRAELPRKRRMMAYV